jgi:hypothetical protein
MEKWQRRKIIIKPDRNPTHHRWSHRLILVDVGQVDEIRRGLWSLDGFHPIYHVLFCDVFTVAEKTHGWPWLRRFIYSPALPYVPLCAIIPHEDLKDRGRQHARSLVSGIRRLWLRTRVAGNGKRQRTTAARWCTHRPRTNATWRRAQMYAWARMADLWWSLSSAAVSPDAS